MFLKNFTIHMAPRHLIRTTFWIYAKCLCLLWNAYHPKNITAEDIFFTTSLRNCNSFVHLCICSACWCSFQINPHCVLGTKITDLFSLLRSLTVLTRCHVSVTLCQSHMRQTCTERIHSTYSNQRTFSVSWVMGTWGFFILIAAIIMIIM